MKKWRSLVAGVLVAVVMAGCGGSASKPSSGEAPKPAQPEPTKPKEPVKLVIGVHQDIQHWDIHNHNFTFTEAVHQNVFDYLVRMNPETGDIGPDLALSWKVVEPTVWEFKLRENVKFHNGDPFTAEDVKFTVERVATDKNLREHRTMNTVKEVKIVNPTTVQIITHKPDPALLNRLTRIGSGILPKAYWDKVGGVEGFKKAPVGTGPFKFKEWVKDNSVTLTAFPDHWRGKAQVDEVVFRVLPETATRVAELQAGGVDIALKIGVDNAKQLKNDSKLTVASGASNRVWLLMVRTQPGSGTANPAIREAIELAIDRKALVDVAEPGLGIPTRTRVTPGITGADPGLYNAGTYDLEKAKKLVADAGGASIGFLARNGSADSVIAQTIVGMLEKAGFKVKLEMVDPSNFNKKLAAAGNPEVYLTAFGNSMKDAELAFSFVTTKIDIDRIGYSPKAVVDLYNGSRTEMDAAKRTDILRKLAQQIAADRPQISLFQSGDVHGVRKGITWKPTRDEMVWVYNIKVGN